MTMPISIALAWWPYSYTSMLNDITGGYSTFNTASFFFSYAFQHHVKYEEWGYLLFGKSFLHALQPNTFGLKNFGGKAWTRFLAQISKDRLKIFRS